MKNLVVGALFLVAVIAADLAQAKSDRDYMQTARKQFQSGNFSAAVENYSKIPQSSDYWLEALEEKSWSYVREKKYGQAMSSIKTVMAPVFAPLIGPEPYFLATFIDLKTCNYTQLFKHVQDFKNAYQPRAIELEKIAKRGVGDKTLQLVHKALAAPTLDWKVLGADVQWLPRMYWRDSSLQKHFALAKKNFKVGARLFFTRIKELAKIESKEIQKNLTKIQLAETEAIQRVHMKENYKNDGKVEQHVTASNEMVFPNSEEIWLDELDHYRVNADGCL